MSSKSEPLSQPNTLFRTIVAVVDLLFAGAYTLMLSNIGIFFVGASAASGSCSGRPSVSFGFMGLTICLSVVLLFVPAVMLWRDQPLRHVVLAIVVQFGLPLLIWIALFWWQSVLCQ